MSFPIIKKSGRSSTARIAVFLAAMFVFVGCDDDPDFYVDRTTLQDEVAAVEARLADFRAEAEEAGDAFAANFNDATAEIEAELEDIGASIDEATDEAYMEARAEWTETVNELDASLTRARIQAIEAREQFVTEAEAAMAEVDEQIRALQADLSRVPAETREEYRETITWLEQRRADLASEWEEFEASAEEDFSEIRDRVAFEISRLEQEINELNYEMRGDVRV